MLSKVCYMVPSFLLKIYINDAFSRPIVVPTACFLLNLLVFSFKFFV